MATPDTNASHGSGGTGGSRGPQALAWFATLPGVLTALAALVTAIGGAFFGGTQVAAPQPTVTVTVTAPARHAPAGTQGGGSNPQPALATSAPVGVTDLSALTPVQDNSQAGVTTGSQQIGTTTYANSVRFTCAYTYSNVVYDVAGYRFLDATIGVPSDATNAAGTGANVTFLKDGTTAQLGSGVSVALDQPQHVHVNLHGASQVEIACAVSGSSGFLDIVLGNATVGPH
jgi:hypothetical protein